MESFKSSSYVIIPDWMYDFDLDLREMLVYAVIYGFSQDGESWFTGTQKYLMRRALCTKPTLLKCLDRLESLGLVRKRKLNAQGKCAYSAVLPSTEASDAYSDEKTDEETEGKEILPQGSNNFTLRVKKFNSEGKEILPKNKDKNIDKINYKNNSANLADTGGASEALYAEKRGTTLYASELRSEFAQAWELYPKKRGKDRARRAYNAARRTGVSQEAIIAGIEAYKARIERERIEPQYVADGGTWFAGKRWEDDNSPFKTHDGGSGGSSKPSEIRQQTYSAQQLRAMGVSLGDDVYDG